MIPDGIYLNMPIAIYRADKALGSTDLKQLLYNPVQWAGRNRNPAMMALFASTADPDKAGKAAAGKLFGDCLHTITLEGEDAFDDRYCLEPEPDKPLPRSREEIGEAMRKAGATPPPANRSKEEFVTAANMAGIPTWDDWTYQRALIIGERQVISPHWDTILRLTRRVLERHPAALRYLSNGRAEVSIFWTDATGVRLKARFDYLRVRALADLKTYAYRDGKEPIQTFADAVESLAYDCQGGHYLDARVNALPGLVAAGLVFDAAGMVDDSGLGVSVASPDDQEFFRKVAAELEPAWVWVSVMTMGVPEVDTIEFPWSGPNKLLQFDVAMSQVGYAKDAYRRFRERFGDDDNELWTADRGLVRLTEYNFGRKSSDRGLAKWESDE